MPDAIMEKLEHIERLILQINARIDNFLGYEVLTPDEEEELKKIRDEVRAGEYSPEYIMVANPRARSYEKYP